MKNKLFIKGDMKKQTADNSKKYIWGKRKNKTWMIIIILVAVVILAGVVGYFVFISDEDLSSTFGLNNSDQNEKMRRAIDGVYFSDGQEDHYPVGIMIENLTSSRPPSGLSKANLVYEALAEGGITRFLAIYGGEIDLIPEIGPVRSARSYYVDWALEYDALYAHVGGSPQSFKDINEYNVFDLNQFYNSQYFWRDSDRLAPHNLYTSGELMTYALRDLEASDKGNYQLWKYKKDASLVDRPSGDKSISIDFSSFNYRVEYEYDAKTNEYVRNQAGEVHTDKDGSEIRVKNIVVQKVKTSLADNEQRLAMETIGEGEAIVFIDGKSVESTWKKESREVRTIFYDSSGDEIEFNAGTTWIEVVPIDRDIVYN